MFRNSLIASIIIHAIILLGVNLIFFNTATVSNVKTTPLYLELATEPAGENESSDIAGNGKILQTMRLSQQSKVTFSAAPKFPVSTLEGGAAKNVTSIDASPALERRPDESVKTDVEPVTDVKKPVAEQQPSFKIFPVVSGPLGPVKIDSGPPAELRNPNTDHRSPVAAASIAPGSDKDDMMSAASGGKLITKRLGPETGESGGAGTARQSSIYAPRPRYPLQARCNNWEGDALLEIMIGTDGRVKKATVLESSGYPVLDRAATQTLYKWRYKPAQQNGRAIQAQTRVRVQFCLKDRED